MSKLSEKMAGWLLKLAKKVDEKTVDDKLIMPAAQLHFIDNPPIILYNEQTVDKIHAQHMMSEEQFRYARDIDIDKLVSIRLAEGITDEIMKLHKDEIKKEEHTGTFGNQTLYSLDVYVCKARRKETV